jgi:hypothetical protein
MNRPLNYLFNKFKKVESEEKLIIRWADTIISESNYKGHVERTSFRPDYILSTHPPTPEERLKWENSKSRQLRNTVVTRLGDIKGQLDIYKNELIKYLDAVKGHLLNEGYIEEPKIQEDYWQLTPIGFLVKELGGHKKYQKYRKREIGLITHQGIINIALILATALAAIMPWIVAATCKSRIILDYPAQSSRQDTHIDTVLLRKVVDDEMQKRLSSQPLKEATSNKQTK